MIFSKRQKKNRTLFPIVLVVCMRVVGWGLAEENREAIGLMTSSGAEIHFTGILPSPLSDGSGQSLQIETVMPRAGLIWALDWSPDGRFIAIGSKAGQIRIYDSSSLTLLKILPGLEGYVNGIHWSPDSKFIAASGSQHDPRVAVWNYEAGSMRVVGQHKKQVRSVRWSPKGTYLASTSHDGKIIVWDPQGHVVKTFTGANFGCVGIDWLNEDTIISSCWDNTIRTYSILAGDGPIFANGELGKKAVLSVDWQPAGDRLAT